MKIILRKILVVFIFQMLTTSLYASGVQHIDNDTLKNLIQDDVAVVDVRTTSEWKKTGVIEGSHLIMFYDEKGIYDLNVWLAEISEVANKDEPLVLICHSGSRSKQLANYLVKVVGYQNVYNVKRGIISWIKNNNPTVAPH